MMTLNPILEELYAIREKLLADADSDIQKVLAGLRKREAASGRLLKPAPRQFTPSVQSTKKKRIMAP
ncbi:MAG TPA: hypothetical protein PKO23_16035 [Candidatus Hydrogenedentes bacterium]|jgi:hypothetical protein|nr:MAG: hypothetical protein BWY09_02577 [Candidatus Hydrogenedentes bacterium ADurb.Bin179]HOC70317.1 hypothetical protein [Candidatus Hydrogenedentota bacterium]